MQRGIPQQEGKIAMIVAARTVARNRFNAPSSGPSKLVRVWAFVYIDSSDARQRHLQRAGLHSINDDLGPQSAGGRWVQKDRRDRQRITFFGRQILKPTAIQLDDIGALSSDRH